ncbi:MAG: hypothetical protein P8H96_09325 [Akkermansiaceae bacterium]|nr:hypothetical protein [Akkermansiaceae bacterium]
MKLHINQELQHELAKQAAGFSSQPGLTMGLSNKTIYEQSTSTALRVIKGTSINIWQEKSAITLIKL